jgi:site-specific recombinase XerD
MDIRTLSQQFYDYSRYMRGYSPDTIQRYRMTIQVFQRLMHVSDIGECTENKIREFFYHGRAIRHWSPNTFATYHRSLVVFFRWCVEQGQLPGNPTDGIELPKVGKALPRRLNKEQSQRLLEIIENYPYRHTFERFRNHAIVAIMLYAGLRRREVVRLHVVDVDLPNRSINVRHGKGNKDRFVPVSPVLAGILQRYLEERRRAGKTCPEVFTARDRDRGLTTEGLKRLVAFAVRVTGMRFSAHTLRHTFATLMLEGGCDIFALSKMMGHSDIKTTTIYLAASAEHLRAQMVKHPLNYV